MAMEATAAQTIKTIKPMKRSMSTLAVASAARWVSCGHRIAAHDIAANLSRQKVVKELGHPLIGEQTPDVGTWMPAARSRRPT